MLHGPRDWLLEVQSESQLDDNVASSSCDENIDAHALNEELSIVCEKLIEKYNLLKKKTCALNKENEKLSSKLDLVLQEKDEILDERDSLKSQLDLVLNENKILRNKNDCDDLLKKNEFLSSN